MKEYMKDLWKMIIDVPKRAMELAIKLLSRKGLMLGGTFYLVSQDMLNSWYQVVAWIFICLFVIGGSEGTKWFKMFKDLKE